MNEEIGEQSTLMAGGMQGAPPSRGLEWDVVLQAKQAKVFGALFRKPVLRRFGRYVVLDVLGQGGMGVVLKGYDEELDRQVAIKLLHRELDAQHTARLRREAQAMAKLSHPNVVQVYEVGELEGQTFVAMELVKGQTVQAWMQQAPRPSWKACVELFLQLGLGLAAAHKRGLVHRDFKPGNAIVDEEGRARVLDFGLARWGKQNDEESSEPGGPMDPDATESLTRTGAVLGTPAYMPPEQMSGHEADARSDQFSFCVALFEAVYGQRPYEGSSMMALLVSMRAGPVRPAPKGSGVPLALRKALVRGLAVDPAERWPSMDVLLAELRRIASPRRGRAVAAVLGVGLVAVGGGLGTTRALEWVNRCTGAEAQLEGAWDEARRQAVKAAILGTGLSYAPGTWERVEPRLDEYAEAWAAEHTDACEATRSRGEQSEEQLGLRMSCLHGRWQHLRATVNELRHADATVVEHAVQAAASLPGLERCRDLDALRAEVPPPEDPAVAEQVAALDERLVEAWAKLEAGQYEAGLRLADAVVMEGARLEYEPLMARAWLRQGGLREKLGDYEEAVQALRQAYGVALAHTMTIEAANAVDYLAFIVGHKLARQNEAGIWAEQARALARAVGTDEALARHLNIMGAVERTQGRYDDARDSFERALAIREKALGPHHPDQATSLGNLATVHFDTGAYDEAKSLYERALAIQKDVLGPDHPDVASSLHRLASVYGATGAYDEAKLLFERALAIQEKALGPHHPNVATSLANLAIIHKATGGYAEARALYERALAIQEQALGPHHPNVATSLGNLATVYFATGAYAEAKALHERALSIKEKALGPHHPDLANSLNNLAIVHEATGAYPEAKALYERALSIKEKALGPDHPDLANSLDNLANVLLDTGAHAEAKALFERAMTIKEKAFGPHHPNVASSLNNLAGVHQATGAEEEAKALHERALAIWEEALGPDHPDVAYSLTNLANVHQAMGAYDEAKPLFERALSIRDKALGPDHPEVAHPLTGLAKVALAQHRPSEAIPLAERSLAIREKAGVPALLLARTRILLARALWDAPADVRDRPRAHALAEQARDALAALGNAEAELADIRAWLAEHPS